MLVASYTWHWNVVFDRTTLVAIGYGAEDTLLVSALALAIGTAIGIAVAIVRTTRIPVLSQAMRVYVDVFRTTPALVQIIWIFYVIPVLTTIRISPLTAGVAALSLNAGAFLSEIFRAGIESVHRGQGDAASVLGYSKSQSLRHIILPQALRRVLPPTSNVFISLIKTSALVSVIAVGELTYQIEAQVASTFRPLELYTALALCYVILTLPVSLLSSALERRYRVT